MGRTNLILLVMGILACVALSLLMHRGLKMQKEARTDPVVKAVTEVFGGRLQVPPRFRIDSQGERRVGFLQVVLELPSSRLTADIGRFAWQQAPGRFDDLVILVKHEMGGEEQTVRIPRPFLATGQSARAARSRTPKPTPKSTPTSQPASRPAVQPAAKPPSR